MRVTATFVPPPALMFAKQRAGSKTTASNIVPLGAGSGIDDILGTAISSPSLLPPSMPTFDVSSNHEPSSPLQLFLPSILAAYDETIPEYQSEQAFQDQVTLSDLTSDPVLQASFAAAAIAIIGLFVAKAVVTQMDEAVGKVAVDFDRVMKLKYPKKWEKFMDDEDAVERVGADTEADRIQLVVEEMERLKAEDPQFVERVMQDIERMQQ